MSGTLPPQWGVLELFAGCGGLAHLADALPRRAGEGHLAVELDCDAAATYAFNRPRATVQREGRRVP